MTTPPHPSVANLLRWFATDHLPEHLRPIVEELRFVAEAAAQRCEGPELAAGLRKLLEAKDCLVRAAIASGAEGPATATLFERVALLEEAIGGPPEILHRGTFESIQDAVVKSDAVPRRIRVSKGFATRLLAEFASDPGLRPLLIGGDGESLTIATLPPVDITTRDELGGAELMVIT